MGKTTFILSLMDYLNQSGRYHALYVNLETAQAAREDVDGAMSAIASVSDVTCSSTLISTPLPIALVMPSTVRCNAWTVIFPTIRIFTVIFLLPNSASALGLYSITFVPTALFLPRS
ncbi:MAG: hypothetical protein AAF639_03215 [Chloroflexota bacterium]